MLWIQSSEAPEITLVDCHCDYGLGKGKVKVSHSLIAVGAVGV